MNILIIAGEMSGDIYGQALAKELLKIEPGISLYGIGGPKIKAITNKFVYETTNFSAIGLFERIRFIKKNHQLLKAVKAFLKKTKIHKTILIDYQHNNFNLAKIIKSHNIPITTYITPNFWIWNNQAQAKKLASYSKKIITIFEREYDLYKKIHPKTFYFGHPLTQLIAPTTSNIDTFKNPTITLFPGSRRQEIKYLLPIMLDTIIKLKTNSPHITINLSLSSKTFLPLINKIIISKNIDYIEIITTTRSKLFLKTTLIISATGTTNIEAVLHNVPIITLGALSKASYFFVKYILCLKIPYVSLPNIICNKSIVPEFVQNKLNPTLICKTAEDLLIKDHHAHAISLYNQVKDHLYKNHSPILDAATAILS
jgi:lipid-A-disaccharide synthase